MKYKTSELAGGLLDAAVAKAEGLEWAPNALDGTMREGILVIDHPAGPEDVFLPSSSWAHGGPIIERELIELTNTENGWYAAVNPWAYYRKSVIVAEAPDGEAETPLVAAMRAFVSAKLGAEVDL